MEFLSSAAPAIAAAHEHGRRAGLLVVVLLIVTVGLLIWLVVRDRRSSRGARSAREILAERYARGEIDTDEYHQRRDQL